MSNKFGVVDLFAGPGGLGEGFSSLKINNAAPFQIGVSIEREVSAHQTLRLRAFLREYKEKNGRLPEEFVSVHAGLKKDVNWSLVDRDAWDKAKNEARCLELGKCETGDEIDNKISEMRKKYDDFILIGGPPCQAYSMAGRARSKSMPNYIPEKDGRHFLFKEYIKVLDGLRPAAFIMENVKGMLSSTIESRLIFEMLMDDLSSLGEKKGTKYVLKAIAIENGFAKLVDPENASSFIVRAEQFGIPQRRHRVIIIGIRVDVSGKLDNIKVKVNTKPVTVGDAIGSLPKLRSGLSKDEDSWDNWLKAIAFETDNLLKVFSGSKDLAIKNELDSIKLAVSSREKELPRSSMELPKDYAEGKNLLSEWLESSDVKAIAQHETRSHMSKDLGRYLFASVYAKVFAYSPKANDFPFSISPEHKNWNTGIFSDRFRVQLLNEPSTTITSHISKDGHYFIHPDPYQCRSLTVREAARLQTFPDDYLFLGNRTQQYVQVGNAVPPLLANYIAKIINQALEKSNDI